MFDLANGASASSEAIATQDGRLQLAVPCDGRRIVIGTAQSGLIVVPPQRPRRLLAGEEQQLSIRVLNPARTANLVATLSSEYPTVRILKDTATVPGEAASTITFPVVLNSGSTEWQHARVNLTMQGKTFPIDLEIAPDLMDNPIEVRVLDGRRATFTVFRQKGNQGGGGPISRTVTEGRGNGDGILQPGERATIWLRYKAGMDGLDRGNWCRAKVYSISGSPWLQEVEDIQEQKQLEWTSAMNRTSVVSLDPATPKDSLIPLLLDCESWTYYYTPDVRYGREPLYQAFQFHKHHLFRALWSGTSQVLQGGQ
ncbi:MAG: hypothetical protein JST65_04225 [Acidobacteria bacterium]|nr:hypothetical protein [Acidobacteriota bacterium]